MGSLLHSKAMAMFVSPTNPRVDLLEPFDGLYDEYGDRTDRGVLDGYISLNGRPCISWDHGGNRTSQEWHQYLQLKLYLGCSPTVPSPYGDHTLTNTSVVSLFQDYAPLFAALRGKRWLLEAFAVRSRYSHSDRPIWSNVFKVDVGVMVVLTAPPVSQRMHSNETALVHLQRLPFDGAPTVTLLVPGRPDSLEPVVKNVSKTVHGLTLTISTLLYHGGAVLILRESGAQPLRAPLKSDEDDLQHKLSKSGQQYLAWMDWKYFVDQFIAPKLHASQNIVLVPGLFGNQTDSWTDNYLMDKLTRYWTWAQNGGTGPCIADYAQNNTVDQLWCQGDASPSNLCTQCGCVVDDGTIFSVPTCQSLLPEALAIIAAAGAKASGIKTDDKHPESSATAYAHPIPTITATDFAPAGGRAWAPPYLSNGFFGIRPGPRALVRSPWSGGTVPADITPDHPVSCLVGGYSYLLPDNRRSEPNKSDTSMGVSSLAPAPFPFETEVQVHPAEGGGSTPLFSLQAYERGEPTGGNLTVLGQTLTMATGELLTEMRATATDGAGWSLRLEVLQFLSREVPSLSLQRITANVSVGFAVSLRAAITTDGMPGRPYNNTTPQRNHWCFR
jgi:hypothetical protein